MNRPRLALTNDLAGLLELENLCFVYDRLSKRSFSNFIKSGSHELWLIDNDQQILAYILILYRQGANLARLYSIAVHPEARGRNLSKILLDWAEEQARKKLCVFMRLEVGISNNAALGLYKKNGYKTIEQIENYYENGETAIRMEKSLYRRQHHVTTHAYYRQTTEYTCGPAALMMAMKTLDPQYTMNRREEFQIWREATTIYMTSGHGGCSPYGLALSAWRRGFDVKLYINQPGAPFLDGVRNEFKKEIMQFVHNEFIRQITVSNIKVNILSLDSEHIEQILEKKQPIVALISTWQLNRNKAPHWVFVSQCDKEYVYINDSDYDEDNPYYNELENIELPIHRKGFLHMAKFGQKRLRCLLVLSD